jgi:hypothetical protein
MLPNRDYSDDWNVALGQCSGMTADDQPRLGDIVPRADSSRMSRNRLVVPAALLLWAWGIFAISYATSRPTEGLLGVSVIIGVTFTCFACLLILLAWTEGEGQLRAALASVLAMAVILLLALLPTMGWG